MQNKIFFLALACLAQPCISFSMEEEPFDQHLLQKKPEISKKNLEFIFHLRKAIEQNAQRRPEKIGGFFTSSVQEIVDKKLQKFKCKRSEKIKTLLLASNHFDDSLLRNAFAHAYVHCQPKLNQEELKAQVTPDLYDLIERQAIWRDSRVQSELNIADYIAQSRHPKKERTWLGTEINLEEKGLTDINGLELIEHNDEIQCMNLENNYLTIIPEGTFNDFINLEGFLNLSWNKFTKIPEDIQKLNHLKELYISKNKITEIPEKIFSRFFHLTWLDLSDNQIREIPEDFKKLSNLEFLILSNNHIGKIPEKVFKRLTHLRWLHLNGNHIFKIPENAFQNLTHLEELYLGNNKLTEIPENTLHNLTNLKDLSLSYNAINHIPQKLLRKLTKLEDFDINNNLLTDFRAYRLLKNLHLKELSLMRNLLNKKQKACIRRYCKKEKIKLKI